MPVKIFVGNLSDKAPPEKLRALFEDYGEVTECDILGSYGFVHMMRQDDAETAINNLKGHFFFGTKINVEISTSTAPKKSTKGRVQAKQAAAGPSRGRGGGPSSRSGGRHAPYPSSRPGKDDPYDRPPPPPDYYRRYDPYGRDPYDPYSRRTPPLDPYDPYRRYPPPPPDYYRWDPYSSRDPYARPPPEYYRRERMYDDARPPPPRDYPPRDYPPRDYPPPRESADYRDFGSRDYPPPRDSQDFRRDYPPPRDDAGLGGGSFADDTPPAPAQQDSFNRPSSTPNRFTDQGPPRNGYNGESPRAPGGFQGGYGDVRPQGGYSRPY